MDGIGRMPERQGIFPDSWLGSVESGEGPRKALERIRTPGGVSRVVGRVRKSSSRTPGALDAVLEVERPSRSDAAFDRPEGEKAWAAGLWESTADLREAAAAVQWNQQAADLGEFGSERPPNSILNVSKCLHDGTQGFASDFGGLPKITIAERAKVKTGPIVSELYTTGNCDVGEAVDRCSTWLRFREWMSGEVKLKGGNFCGQPKLCVWCSRRRAIRMMREHLGKTLNILGAHPEWVPCMVTITVKDGADLGERMQHLKRSLDVVKKRRQNCINGGRGKWTEFARIQAAVWHFEVTRGKGSGLWHPHVHGLALRGRDDLFDLKAMKAEWQEITGDSMVLQVDLTHAGRLMVNSGLPSWHPEVEPLLVGDLCECFKYPLKFSSMTPADVVECWKITKGVRFLTEWGSVFKAAEPDDLTDDGEGVSAFFRDHIYRWVKDAKNYVSDGPGEWEDGSF